MRLLTSSSLAGADITIYVPRGNQTRRKRTLEALTEGRLYSLAKGHGVISRDTG